MNKKLIIGIVLISISVALLLGVVYGVDIITKLLLPIFGVISLIEIFCCGLLLLIKVREERAITKQFTEAAKHVMKKYEKALRNLED